MTVDPWTLAAVLGMAAVTYATRIAGIFFGDKLALAGRAKAAFDAIPAAVLVAVIAPMVLATGPAETAASAVTIVAAARLPLIATMMVGIATIIVLRIALG